MKTNVQQPVRVATNMREAFARVKFQHGSDTSNTIINVLSTGSGLFRPNRGWTANVTARTAKQLIKEGVFA